MEYGSRKIDIQAGDSIEIVDFEQSPAGLDLEKLKSITDWLYSVSDNNYLASFSDLSYNGDVGVILFCGFHERFRTISLLRHLRVSCLVVQDPVAPWYTGSGRCPKIADIKVAAEARFPWVQRWVLMGQSSGGYAALLMSRLMDCSIALALAPQTFDDSPFKETSICFPPTFKVSRTMNVGSKIIDLRDVFFQKPASSGNHVYIVSALSEHENPPTEWLWVDAMHWGRLIDHPDVMVFVTRATSHSILFRNVDAFARLLAKIVQQPDWERARMVEAIKMAVYVVPDHV